MTRSRIFPTLAAGIAISALGWAGAARAQDPDSYAKTGQVNLPSHTTTCSGATPTNFSFDISWVEQSRGDYLLADKSHGRPSSNTEGGLVSGDTSGDILLIDTDHPGSGPSFILPPEDDPFAGVRCDTNAAFGGVGTRNEIGGPNGLFTVNGTEVWAGDGPSDFTPGQTNQATDYRNDPCDSSVRVFNLITREQTDHINVHGCFRTDEGAFDPVDQVVLFANPSENDGVASIDPHARSVDHSPFITLISAIASREGDDDHGDGDRGHHEILKQINFDGTNGTIFADMGIEQAVYSRQTGFFYIAIPGATSNPGGYVVVVDPSPGALKVVQNFPLASCAPSGAVLGPNYEMFLGCSGAPTEVIDIRTGAERPIANAPNSPSEGCDEVAYDAGSGHFGGACGPLPKFTVQVSDAYPLTFDTSLGGAIGAHSIAADSTNANFWMPMFGGDCGAPIACVAIYAGDQSDQSGN